MAIGKLLRGIVELSTLLGKDEITQFEIINPNHEISMSDGVEILSRLVSLCRQKEIEDLPDEFDMNILFETLEASSFDPLPELAVKTHIRDFAVDLTAVESGRLVTWAKVLDSKQVDIHNIDENPQSLFD